MISKRFMLLAPRGAVAGALLFAMLAIPQDREAWEKANAKVRRLSPAAFKELPNAVREKLEELGCVIPQTFLGGEPHNVIRGEFARKGQEDWAALCSIERKSSIRVFWGGPVRCEEKFEPVEDLLSLQGVGEGKIGYSSLITPADKNFIERHYKAYGGPQPPVITHQGIDHAFVGKASVVLYCHEGKWLRLTGSD